MRRILTFNYNLLNAFLGLFRKLLFWPGRNLKNPRNILIFRVGNIGDIICSIPSMIAIRGNFPKAKITLLSSPGKQEMPGAKELLTNAGFLDRLIVYSREEIDTLKKKINLINKLRKIQFDLVVELPPNLAKFRIQIRDLIFAKLIGARYALGFRINTIRMFRRTQSKYLCFHNEAERLLIILRKEGLRVDKAPFALPISSADKKVINNFLTELNGSTNLIAINPNAKRKTNLWFLDRFAQVGRRLIEDRNVRIAIVGSKKDSQKSRQLKEMIGEGAVDVAGRFTLLQAIELLKHCQLLISGDTGTVHMAAAVGTPVVGVYSARDHKGKWHPYGENNIIIRKDPACNICYREACRHLTCLKMIGEDEVLMAAEQLLRNPVRRHSPLAGVNHQ